MRRLVEWWRCRRDCGVSNIAVYLCNRPTCPGRLYCEAPWDLRWEARR